MRLQKHHGSGNDFLVLLDLDGTQPVGPERARALCDRHRGVGADGLIRVTPDDDGGGAADVRMELFNADGSRAETSGNGLRCVGQAVVDAALAAGPDVVVRTDAGVRKLHVGPEHSPGERCVSVDMGGAADGPATSFAGKTMSVSMGNPHLVVLVDDVADQAAPGRPDLNVELIMLGPGHDELTMRVWERGVGETLACGTGACAAAWAANRWGLVGESVTVHQPGGDLAVELGGTITLTGPAQHVATAEVR